ncbi:MAG: hypothetical protein ACRDXX_10360 [Stackebrandtia sp.]
MRAVVIPLVVVVGLGLTACASEEGGYQEPLAAKTKSVVRAAVDDLETRPVLEFEGALDELTGGGESAVIKTEVVETGDAYTTAEIGGHEIKLMTVDGVYYVSAPEEFWEDQGVDSSHAKKIDGEWTQVDPEVWFDLGLLTAEQYAAALEEAVTDAGVLDTELPEPADYNGVEAYAIPVGESGTVYISVAEPHTVLGVEGVEVTIDNSTLVLDSDVAGIDAEQVEKLLEKLTDAVKDMKEIFDDGADLQLSEDPSSFTCSNSTFTCEHSVSVTASFRGKYLLADKVKLKMKVTMDGGSIGTKKCDDSATVDLGESASLKCTATFNPPADGVPYDILSTHTITGVTTYKPDVDAITEKLAEDFESILGEFG